MCGRKSRLFSLISALILASSPGLGAVIYDSNGFEGPKFAPGTIVKQDGWTSAGGSGVGAGAGTIAAGFGVDGTNGLLVAHNSSDTFFWPGGVPLLKPSAPDQLVLIDWDMNVTPTQQYDWPLVFGMEAYQNKPGGSSGVVGAMWVDSATGDIIFQAPVSGTPFATGAKATLGQFNHFQLALNYANHTYQISYNGTQIINVPGFVDDSARDPIDSFTEADVSTREFDYFFQYPTEQGTAIIDNYRVTTTSVPEPAAVAMLGFAVIPFMSRPRRGSP